MRIVAMTAKVPCLGPVIEIFSPLAWALSVTKKTPNEGSGSCCMCWRKETALLVEQFVEDVLLQRVVVVVFGRAALSVTTNPVFGAYC